MATTSNLDLNPSILKRIEDWYSSVCNGDWEHTYGVSIETLDNPGWAVKIQLIDTPLADKAFEPINIQRETDSDWLNIKVEHSIFLGHGGPGNLEDILDIFIRWVAT